jgi:nitroreductase
MDKDAMITAVVDENIRSRRSARAFLPTPVPREEIDAVLRIASRSPSGTNTQPWKVYVVSGEARISLSAKILDVYNDPEKMKQHQREPFDWPQPYLGRRRKVGWDLYNLIGIPKADKERMHAQHGRNYAFFDAPVGLIFTIERVLKQSSFLDCGMFMQTIMLAACARGIDTCPQGAFIQFEKIIAEHLRLPEGERVICGMAMGYADPAAPENNLVTERDPLENFVRYIE